MPHNGLFGEMPCSFCLQLFNACFHFSKNKAIIDIMSWKLPISMTSILLLSFLLVLSGPALEGCQSASVGDTSGSRAPDGEQEHLNKRVHPNAGKLSDKDHGHFHEYEDVHDEGDGEHRERREEDYEYDHEAFLGDDAHEFDDLDPEESKVRTK